MSARVVNNFWDIDQAYERELGRLKAEVALARSGERDAAGKLAVAELELAAALRVKAESEALRETSSSRGEGEGNLLCRGRFHVHASRAPSGLGYLWGPTTLSSFNLQGPFQSFIVQARLLPRQPRQRFWLLALLPMTGMSCTCAH